MNNNFNDRIEQILKEGKKCRRQLAIGPATP